MLSLIKFPFKVVVLPFMVAFACLSFLVKLITNVSGYVLSPLILFILFCGIYSMAHQQWNHVLLLGTIELCCIALLFGSVVIETALDWCYCLTRSFVQS